MAAAAVSPRPDLAIAPPHHPVPAFDAARRAQAHNTRLSEKLLAMAGQLDLKPEELELNSWLPRFIKLQRFNYPSSIRFESHICEEPCVLNADRDWLHHVLCELMNNAADAMPQGGKILFTLAPHPENTRRFARISVTDNGIGMEPALLAHVLKPLVTTKESHNHKGWGLAVCDGFARQSGGWLELESSYHRGTTAILTLPQRDPLFPALHLGA